MKAPDFSRVLETFVRIPGTASIPTDTTALSDLWQKYIALLGHTVEPLVKHLIGKDMVNWYSFLVHDKQSGGIPTADPDWFIHLRLEIGVKSTEQDLRRELPAQCEFTRMMSPPPRTALDNIPATSLVGGSIEEGWRILGEASEWSLRMLAAHDDTKRLPRDNVAQFLHYIGNQLLVGLVGVPTP